MPADEDNTLLAAVLEAIDRLRQNVPTKDAFDVLDRRVTEMGLLVTDIRHDAKGANNWAKIASALVPLVPIVVALAKGLGWI